MHQLNLPEANLNLRKSKGKIEIFDVIRKKYVVLTPEEWVRQNFVHYLIEHLNFPRSLMKVESAHTYNTLHKRSDITVYGPHMQPYLLVECKATTVPINQRSFDQVLAYNKKINAELLVLTNGLTHYCCQVNGGRHTFLSTLPSYEDVKNTP